MTKTLLVPGYQGSPAPHWQDWWAATDPNAAMVDLPEPFNPDPALWEIELAGMILRHPGCVLVGHSLGSILIARILSKWPQLRIRAALLVAPAETAGNDRIGHFGPIPEEPFGVPAVVVGSRDDPWMPHDRARQLANAWGAGFVDLGHAGHVNVATGFGPWPGGKFLRDTLLAHTAASAGQAGQTRRIAG